MVTSSMCISETTRFITSTGHGEPAMIPVRSEEKSYDANCSHPSSAMNMVGTPYSDVHRLACTVSNVATGSNEGAGITMQAPCEVAARLPITMPKPVSYTHLTLPTIYSV